MEEKADEGVEEKDLSLIIGDSEVSIAAEKVISEEVMVEEMGWLTVSWGCQMGATDY